MSDRAHALQAAHLAFLLDELQGDRLEEWLREEAEAYCHYIADLPLQQLLPAPTVIAWIQRNILGFAPTDALRKQLVVLIESGLDHANSQGHSLRDLINRQLFDMMVERLISRPELRRDLLDMLISSPAAHQLMTNVLVNNLVGYLTTNNPVARHVPGASSLLKMGTDFIGRVGSADQTLTRSIRSYVRRTLKDTTETLVDLLAKSLSNEQLRLYADELWPKLADYRFGTARRHLELEGYSYLAVVFWNLMRTTPFMQQQIAFLVTSWYAQHGEEPVLSVLESWGITADQVIREVVHLGRPITLAMHHGQHLEKRLSEHLTRFYNTPAAHAALTDTEVPSP